MKNQETTPNIQVTILPVETPKDFPPDVLSPGELGVLIAQKLSEQFAKEDGKQFLLQFALNGEVYVLEEQTFMLKKDSAQAGRHENDYTHHYWIENL